jgi:NADH dehydrogenase
MATIGRNKAIAQIGKVQLSGMLAWTLWLTVHLLFLVEIRRRFAVLLEWAWAYVTWHRGSRLIVDVPVSQGRTVAQSRPPRSAATARIAPTTGAAAAVAAPTAIETIGPSKLKADLVRRDQDPTIQPVRTRSSSL